MRMLRSVCRWRWSPAGCVPMCDERSILVCQDGALPSTRYAPIRIRASSTPVEAELIHHVSVAQLTSLALWCGENRSAIGATTAGGLACARSYRGLTWGPDLRPALLGTKWPSWTPTHSNGTARPIPRGSASRQVRPSGRFPLLGPPWPSDRISPATCTLRPALSVRPGSSRSPTCARRWRLGKEEDQHLQSFVFVRATT